MLTKLTVRNFKCFETVEIELGNPVVFIGPNNSGKTTALQALSLWYVGLKRWNEKRRGKATPERRPGVTINRRDLIAVPVPDANLLWRNLHVRDIQKKNGKQETQNVRVEVIVEGVSDNKTWQCGLEFDYANEESFYCRPLRKSEAKDSERMPVPTMLDDLRVAFLPPMSGLSTNETRLDPGAVNVRLGEGRTAEVLRNLCHQIVMGESGQDRWQAVSGRMTDLFGVSLDEPQYIAERGEIRMTYKDRNGIRLDLSSSGRGLQQTLLLLAHLACNPRSVLLLDEPDAHLEILRQRQTYQVLTEFARENESQIVLASHSEVLLNEAGDRDMVVAFVGKPHRIDDRGSQLMKSLKEIGFEDYYQAEQTGWVLYLEGSTDLAILRALAALLGHPVLAHLDRPFVHYVMNQPSKARDHFYGLREAKADLVAFALFDRLNQALQTRPELAEYEWKRREIENYIATPETLLRYAEGSAEQETPGPLFKGPEQARRREVMDQCIKDNVPPAAMRDRSHRFWVDTKASDDFLNILFETFFQKLGLPNLMRKTDYHVLARFVYAAELDSEVTIVLDRMLESVKKAGSTGS